MRARINEASNLAVLITDENDRLAADRGGVEIVGTRQLAFVGQVDPRTFENIAHLELEQAGVGEKRPIYREHSLRRAVHYIGTTVSLRLAIRHRVVTTRVKCLLQAIDAH